MTCSKSRTLTLALVLGLLAIPTFAPAQLPAGARGYYLNVPLWSEATPFNAGGLGDLQRVRLMMSPVRDKVSLDIAYEQFVSFSQRRNAGSGGLGTAVAPAGGGLLDLDWTIAEGDHVLWRHRLDRLSISYSPSEAVEVTVGRQTISWATTLLLTPADPFVPFDPADPFREFRAGVDAVRVQFFPGPLADVDLVLRGSDTPGGDLVTALGRVRGVVSGWEVSAWAGALHEDAAFGMGGTGGIGQVALRVETSVRADDQGSGVALRGVVGIDTRFTLADRDLHVAMEYQHDDFGASSAADIRRVLLFEPFGRGEIQVVGRDATVAQGTYQLHPLWSAGLLAIWNLNDRSALVVPSLSYPLSNEATARAGAFLGIGSGQTTSAVAVPSGFGVVPATAYGSVSWFF